MKTVMCDAWEPLEPLVTEGPALVAGPGKVAVTVNGASVGFPDRLIIQNKNRT